MFNIFEYVHSQWCVLNFQTQMYIRIIFNTLLTAPQNKTFLKWLAKYTFFSQCLPS